MIGRKRRRCGRTSLPQQYTIRKKNLKIRKQPKNMCVAHAITAMNELRSGVELDVTDCYTKGMGDSGERLFQVVDRIRNKGQRAVSSKVRLCFDAKPLKRPYVDSIKRALAANKAVVVTIKTYNHESTVQSCYDKDGIKKNKKNDRMRYAFTDTMMALPKKTCTPRKRVTSTSSIVMGHG